MRPWGKKIKIPASYVFSYNPSAHSWAIIAKSSHNCRRSTNRCAKMTQNSLFSDPCDLDLDPKFSKPGGGWHFFQFASTLNVSWKSKAIKGVKRVGQTDVINYLIKWCGCHAKPHHKSSKVLTFIYFVWMDLAAIADPDPVISVMLMYLLVSYSHIW